MGREAAQDPLSERDYDHALDALHLQDAERAHIERLVKLGVPRKTLDPDTIHVSDPHEPPPF